MPLISETSFLMSFRTLYEPTTSNQPRTVLDFGIQSELSLLLDSHQSDIFASERGSFWFKVTQAGLDQLDMSEDGAVQVEAGLNTVFYVSYRAKEASTSATLLRMDIRGCRLKNEVTENMKIMFKQYTRRSCIYACLLKLAMQEMECVPWNIYYVEVGLDHKIK